MNGLNQFSAIVLAAGLSSRMANKGNKLLLPYKGHTILASSLKAIKEMDFLETILVSGHQKQEVESEVEAGIRCVFNPSYRSGMHASIQAGIRALNLNCVGFAIFLADQPFYEVASLRRYLDVAAKKISLNEAQIVCPKYQGQTGHPVLFAVKYRDEILSQAPGDHGCNYLFKRYPEEVQSIEVDAMAFTSDIDDESTYEESEYDEVAN